MAIRRLELAGPRQEFKPGTFKGGAVWVNQAYVDKAQKLLPTLGAKFPFAIELLETQVYGTQYCLKPKDTILLTKAPTRNVLVHELGHHVFHTKLPPKDKKVLDSLCKPKKLDSNEQFASIAEFLVCGSCKRFEKDGQSVDPKLAQNKDLVAMVSKYFSF